MPKRLYVGNIPDTVHEDDLLALFSQAGSVLSVAGLRDSESDEPTGFAWVEMATDEDAENAIRMLDGHAMENQAIQVRRAIEHPTPGGEEPGIAY